LHAPARFPAAVGAHGFYDARRTRRTVPWVTRKHLQAVAAGLVCAGVALTITPSVSSETRLGRLEVAFRPGPGRTHLELPPVGTVTADTHWSPLGVHVQLQRLELRRLGDLETGTTDQLLAGVRGDLIRSLVLQGAFTFVIAILLTWLLVRSVRSLTTGHLRRNALPAAAGSLLVIGALAGTFYSTDAFRNPVFRGPIEEAPEVLRRLDGALDGAGQVTRRIDAITEHLEALSQPAETVPDEDETTLLHVSDIHSNPLGVVWINTLVDRFAIDLVIDTGDITSFGYEPESSTIETPLTVPTERYWIAYGNHDGDSVRERLSNRLTPLDGRTLTWTTATGDPLDVLGIDDPTFTPKEGVPDDVASRAYEQAGQELATMCRRDRPHIVAVHNPILAVDVDGCADIVIAGHLHEADHYRLPGGTLVAVSGTSGAGGVEGLNPEGRYAAQILRYIGSELRAIDVVSMNPETGEFTIERIDPDRILER
jgi:predicted MPP superfamily phosphohydrolase